MKIDFPSEFLKASDLGNREVKLTMANVEQKKIGNDDRFVLHFLGQQKGLVLNKTNADTIGAAYGYESDDWHGQPLYLFSIKTDYKGQVVDAIRCRAPTAKEMLAATNPIKRELQRYPDDRITSGPQRAVPRMSGAAMGDMNRAPASDFPGDEPPPWDQA